MRTCGNRRLTEELLNDNVSRILVGRITQIGQNRIQNIVGNPEPYVNLVVIRRRGINKHKGFTGETSVQNGKRTF